MPNYTYTTGGGSGTSSWNSATGVSSGIGGGGGGGYLPGNTYVRNATQSCRERGCQAPELAALARHLSDEAHKTLETMLNRKEGQQMEPTRALWCEQGDHSFSEKDPDLQVITMQRRGPEGEKVEESRTTCGKCAAIVMNRIGQAQNTTVSPLPQGDE